MNWTKITGKWLWWIGSKFLVIKYDFEFMLISAQSGVKAHTKKFWFSRSCRLPLFRSKPSDFLWLNLQEFMYDRCFTSPLWLVALQTIWGFKTLCCNKIHIWNFQAFPSRDWVSNSVWTSLGATINLCIIFITYCIQLTFIGSKSSIETLGKGVKYVQS